jgi:hypothetical protein
MLISRSLNSRIQEVLELFEQVDKDPPSAIKGIRRKLLDEGSSKHQWLQYKKYCKQVTTLEEALSEALKIVDKFSNKNDEQSRQLENLLELAIRMVSAAREFENYTHTMTVEILPKLHECVLRIVTIVEGRSSKRRADGVSSGAKKLGASSSQEPDASLNAIVAQPETVTVLNRNPGDRVAQLGERGAGGAELGAKEVEKKWNTDG